jgi:TonB family protein
MTEAPRNVPLLLLAPLLLVLAGCASGGTERSGGEGGADAEDVGDLSGLMCPDGPTWAVDGSSEPPVVLNHGVVSQRLVREYNGPRRPGGMRALLNARVTRGGTIDQVCIVESSGIPRFDRGAALAALGLRYQPASTNGEPRSVSVQFEALMPGRE